MKCPSCRTDHTPFRSGHRFCSARCRAKAFRGRRKTELAQALQRVAEHAVSTLQRLRGNRPLRRSALLDELAAEVFVPAEREAQLARLLVPRRMGASRHEREPSIEPPR